MSGWRVSVTPVGAPEPARESRRLAADAICQEEASASFIAKHAPNWNRRTCSDEQGHWISPSPILPLNLIGLTTLPFLHAIWTGIPGYFIGFARLYPERRTGLLMVAIGLPTLLHGCYGAFGNSLSGLGFALLSVLALVLYLAKSADFENSLRRHHPE